MSLSSRSDTKDRLQDYVTGEIEDPSFGCLVWPIKEFRNESRRDNVETIIIIIIISICEKNNREAS